MEQKMTLDRVIKTREFLLRQGIDEINLQCLHLLNQKTDKASPKKMFGVLLCEQCDKEVNETSS